MRSYQIAFLLLCSSICTSTIFAKEKSNRSKDDHPIVKRYILNAGIQYGVGAPLSSNSLGDLKTSFSFSHNLNVYLKLHLKQISIYGGLRNSSFQIKRSLLDQSISDNYSKPDFNIRSQSSVSTADVATPYLGIAYHLNTSQIDLEPYARLGLGIITYDIRTIEFASKNSAALDQTIYFNDVTPQVFLNPGIGLNAFKKLSNFIRISGSLALDFGNPGRSELQEITDQRPHATIRKRNIYLQQGTSNLCIMLGLEITPFNKIYSNEKKYNRIKK